MWKDEINDWIYEAYDNNKYNEGFNIHIDQIFPRVKKKDWLIKAFSCYPYIINEIKKRNIELNVILVMSLNNWPYGLNDSLTDFRDISPELFSHQPPSFYLADKEYTCDIISNIKILNFIIEGKTYEVYLKRTCHIDYEYFSILLAVLYRNTHEI